MANLEDNINHPISAKETINLENWMGTLPEKLLNIPIINLSIPGSHNSFTYSITSKSSVSPDSPTIVQLLSKWFKPIANRFICNWCKAQDADVTTQLIGGIRYFDIRLVNRDPNILIAHGLYGGPINTFLMEIKAFLQTHPKEVVVLDFQHFFVFGEAQHNQMAELIFEVFGGLLIHQPIYLNDVTLRNIQRLKKQVVVVYRNSFAAKHKIFWQSIMWPTPWPNKLNTGDLENYLNEELDSRVSTRGLVTQCILTPTFKYTALRFYGSLKRLSYFCNKKMLLWIESKCAGKSGLNVVICDFFDTFDFAKTVVGLNYKYLEEMEQDTLKH